MADVQVNQVIDARTGSHYMPTARTVWVRRTCISLLILHSLYSATFVSFGLFY